MASAGPSHVDDGDGIVLLQIHEERGVVARPGEVLRLQVPQAPQLSKKGEECKDSATEDHGRGVGGPGSGKVEVVLPLGMVIEIP